MKRQRFYCFIYFAQNTDIHLSGNSVKLHDWPITGSQLLALSSERVNPDSEGDASKVEIQKNGSTVLILTSANTEQKRLVTWKQQSTKVNLGTITISLSWYKISLFQWILPVWNQNFTGDGEEFMKDSKSRYRSQKLFLRTIDWNLTSPVKNYHGIIGQAFSHRSETTNCRTSCTSSKRRNISRIIAIWIDSRMTTRFHEMLLLSAESPKLPRKREISDLIEDLGNHSKDQLHYLTHWLDISQNSEKNKKKNSSIWKEIITTNVLLVVYFSRWGIWEEDIPITEVEELGNLASLKYISEDWMRKKSW